MRIASLIFTIVGNTCLTVSLIGKGLIPEAIGVLAFGIALVIAIAELIVSE